MTAVCPNASDVPTPRWYRSDQPLLTPDSPLSHLSLHQFQVDSTCLLRDVLPAFEQFPQLPGVVLWAGDRLLGVISRQRLLESLIRPEGIELFLKQPIHVLYHYVRRPMLTFAADTPILQAAQQVMRRGMQTYPSPEQWGEPLLVRADENYYILDVYELHLACWQIRGIETQVRYERAQVQMIQTEKMASLGRLVDGVAHEILDPVGFIWGNLTHVSFYIEQLLALNTAYEALLSDPLPPAIQTLREEAELDYLRHDLPKAIASIQAGAERLKTLASGLQNFCHIDDIYPKATNLHECIDGILLLLKSRLSSEIHVVKHYGHLPPVSCYSGQLNQVFINILTNAIDALLNRAVYYQQIGEPIANASPPQITITTAVQPDPRNTTPMATRWVSIRIANNGPSLTPAQMQQLDDCFSTRHRVAKETSLALSYHIVTAKHGGHLTWRSPCIPGSAAQPPHGTEFEITLPLN